MPLPWHYKTAKISMFYGPEMRQMFCFSYQSILMPKELGTFLHCLMWVGSLVSFNVISLFITPVQERLWDTQLTYFIFHNALFPLKKSGSKGTELRAVLKSENLVKYLHSQWYCPVQIGIVTLWNLLAPSSWVLVTTYQNVFLLLF